jgi:hypothetical protein
MKIDYKAWWGLGRKEDNREDQRGECDHLGGAARTVISLARGY